MKTLVIWKGKPAVDASPTPLGIQSLEGFGIMVGLEFEIAQQRPPRKSWAASTPPATQPL